MAKVNDSDLVLEANKKVVTEKIVARSSDGLLLEDDGGNYIKLNDGGIVSISKPSFIHVYRSTTQTIPTAVRTIIEYNSIVNDFHSEFDDTSTYAFTATKEGYYSVNTQVGVDTLGDGDHFIISIYKNN